jgi:hypothetical protein
MAAHIGYTFAMRASITASPVFLLFLLAGCQHETPTFKFQIVDAQTRQGLANVKVETILTGSQMGIGALPVDEDDFDSSMIARTDHNGLVTLNLKAERGLYYFLFLTKPGYGVVSGKLHPLQGISDLKTYPVDALPAVVMSQRLPDIEIKPKTTTVIPMQRLPGK